MNVTTTLFIHVLTKCDNVKQIHKHGYVHLLKQKKSLNK